MDEAADLGFCSVEYRTGFMIVVIKPGHSIGYAETRVLADHKRDRLGDTQLGLVIFSPSHAEVEVDLFTRAGTIMEEQGYSFLVIANPSAKHLMMLELMRDYCSVKLVGTLEEAIEHAEYLVGTGVCG
ncbi:MAG TPA: hypothetical protein VMC79_03220 [Rectinemataceae bacterium]|nr:hypothetical protein [Rectinemataceae bacterium]